MANFEIRIYSIINLVPSALIETDVVFLIVIYATLSVLLRFLTPANGTICWRCCLCLND